MFDDWFKLAYKPKSLFYDVCIFIFVGIRCSGADGGDQISIFVFEGGLKVWSSTEDGSDNTLFVNWYHFCRDE